MRWRKFQLSAQNMIMFGELQIRDLGCARAASAQLARRRPLAELATLCTLAFLWSCHSPSERQMQNLLLHPWTQVGLQARQQRCWQLKQCLKRH